MLGHRLLKFYCNLNVVIFWLFFPLSIRLLSCVSVSNSYRFQSLSLILAKRLIATLKHYKGILEIWVLLIFSNLEVRSFRYLRGRKTKDLVGYVKVKWYPLTSVGDQSSPKLTTSLFAGLPYVRNRSLDWDLFCRESSARLPSTWHAHKMNSRSGIIIYAASQFKLICFLFSVPLVSTQLNGFKYCYLTLISLFNGNNFFADNWIMK